MLDEFDIGGREVLPVFAHAEVKEDGAVQRWVGDEEGVGWDGEAVVAFCDGGEEVVCGEV